MNTAKCYRNSCPFMKDSKCDRPIGTCGGNRWTRKPKQESKIVEKTETNKTKSKSKKGEN